MDGRVLLIDNSSYERQKVRHILGKMQFEDVVEVQSISQFRLLDLDSIGVRLAIADITFPTESEGFEVLGRLREIKSYAHIPIIIVSKSDKPENKAGALKFSVSDYIVKPYQIKRLEKSISSVIDMQMSFHYDTGGMSEIKMSFDDYISREMKYAKRLHSPLSFIFITTLRLNDPGPGAAAANPDRKETIFSLAAEKARNSLRATDTIVMSRDRDILIILPGTDNAGAGLVCEKIKSALFDGLEKLNADRAEYIYPVHFTFPEDGEDFQALMENAFKKVSDKEMLEKIVSIPANTLKYADRSYNRYRKWF